MVDFYLFDNFSFNLFNKYFFLSSLFFFLIIIVLFFCFFTKSCSAHVHVRDHKSVTFFVHKTSSGSGRVDKNKALQKWDFQRKTKKTTKKKHGHVTESCKSGVGTNASMQVLSKSRDKMEGKRQKNGESSRQRTHSRNELQKGNKTSGIFHICI